MIESFEEFILRRHKQVGMPITMYFIGLSIPIFNILFWIAMLSNYYTLRKSVIDGKEGKK